MGAYKHLSCEERTMIQLSLEQGCKLRAIARSLHRAPSSISRELRSLRSRRVDRGYGLERKTGAFEFQVGGIVAVFTSDLRSSSHNGQISFA